MSWSVSAKGTPEQCRTELEQAFEFPIKTYEGKTEQADVLAAKAAVMSAIAEAGSMEADSAAPSGYEMKISAYGSRSPGWNCCIHVDVAKVPIGA